MAASLGRGGRPKKGSTKAYQKSKHFCATSAARLSSRLYFITWKTSS